MIFLAGIHHAKPAIDGLKKQARIPVFAVDSVLGFLDYPTGLSTPSFDLTTDIRYGIIAVVIGLEKLENVSLHALAERVCDIFLKVLS